jgi:hypothetical protein
MRNSMILRPQRQAVKLGMNIVITNKVGKHSTSPDNPSAEAS